LRGPAGRQAGRLPSSPSRLTTPIRFTSRPGRSCNFFYGTFDKSRYFALYHDYLVGLERLDKERKAAGADVKAE
jgi:hypothetical protein